MFKHDYNKSEKYIEYYHSYYISDLNILYYKIKFIIS